MQYKDRRSVDAYGRSTELAIANYLLDNGDFPTDVSQLTIEYSGDEVVCSTTKLNSDSSVYIDGCTVDGRIVECHYGENKSSAPVTPSYTAYQVGDHVSYNGVTYYVIENSDTSNDTVKLLKEEPLTKTEMNSLNLSGITIGEKNGYGKIQYGSSIDYSTSTVKQVVDVWKNTAVKSGDIATARLITYDELMDNLGYEVDPSVATQRKPGATNTLSWVYNIHSSYSTMTQYEDSNDVWTIDDYGNLGSLRGHPDGCIVHPVLELNKFAEITKLSS